MNIFNFFRLGLILGAKIFIDFTKYQFETSMEKLKKEISQDKKQSNLQANTAKSSWKKLENNLVTNSVLQYMTPKPSEQVVKQAPSTQSWTKTQVQEWLRANSIDENIQKALIDFNGEMISELINIRNTASEYFFNSISQRNLVQLNEVVKFSNVLRKLVFVKE